MTFSLPNVKAQTKIGNNPNAIDPAAILELEHPNKALYLTRVALITTSDITTVPSPKAGMIVYNTNSSIFATNFTHTASGAGLYYYDGSGWVYSGFGTLANSYWSLNGNSGVSTSNFIGTTDAQQFAIRTNNV